MIKPSMNLDDVEEQDVAYRIINTGKTTMRYLALSNIAELETGRRGEPGLRKVFRAENTVDYYDRESTVEHGDTLPAG